MGWNDRLPEDPYTPPESFYRDRDDYEAWLEYVETQLDKEGVGLTSQNLDPQTLSKKAQQETPARQPAMSRLWAQIFGQNTSKTSSQDTAERERIRTENVDIPF